MFGLKKMYNTMPKYVQRVLPGRRKVDYTTFTFDQFSVQNN